MYRSPQRRGALDALKPTAGVWHQLSLRSRVETGGSHGEVEHETNLDHGLQEGLNVSRKAGAVAKDLPRDGRVLDDALKVEPKDNSYESENKGKEHPP